VHQVRKRALIEFEQLCPKWNAYLNGTGNYEGIDVADYSKSIVGEANGFSSQYAMTDWNEINTREYLGGIWGKWDSEDPYRKGCNQCYHWDYEFAKQFEPEPDMSKGIFDQKRLPAKLKQPNRFEVTKAMFMLHWNEEHEKSCSLW